MPLEIGWKKLLEDNLREYHPDSPLKLDDVLGFDLDGDGHIRGNEIIDGIIPGQRMDYYVDEAEAKQFCIINRDLLSQKIWFLRTGRDHEFLADNPVHTLILYEYQVLNTYHTNHIEELVEKTYEELAGIRNSVIGLELLWSLNYGREPTPHEHMWFVHYAMKDRGILFELGGSMFLIENLPAPRKIFDCLSTFVLLATAHEMEWPVRPILTPRHIFARWGEDESGNFEVQNGLHYENEFYIRYDENKKKTLGPREEPRIAELSIERGAYLQPLDEERLEGIFYYNIGQALYLSTVTSEPLFEESIEAYDETITRYPENPMAYAARGLAQIEINNFDQAIIDFNDALERDPNFAVAYEGLGLAYLYLRDYENALENLNRAIELNETASAYINRGLAKSNIAQLTDDRTQQRRLIRSAIRDYERAIELDPDNLMAIDNLTEIESVFPNY